MKIKTDLQQLAEKIRFSDPMSDYSLEEIEGKIAAKISELRTESDKIIIIQELNFLITERNKKCKILK